MSLTNSQYENLIRIYDDRRLARQQLIDSRKEEIYRKSSYIKELDDLVSERSIFYARERIKGDRTATEKLEKELSEIALKKSLALEAIGYPSDYFKVAYHCPDCKDTGFIEGEKCHCFKQAEIDLLYTESHLSAVLQEETFDRFSLEYYSSEIYDDTTGISSRDAAAIAFEKCKAFADDFGTNDDNMLIFGDTGVGKTFLSHCIAGELINKGYSVIYFSAYKLFDILSDVAYKRTVDSSEYERIFNCDLLIIDDLGTERPNQFTVSQLFVCLNERLARKKPILISSNLGLSEIANVYSERIFSRISNGFIMLHLFGKDIRIEKRLNGGSTNV